MKSFFVFISVFSLFLKADTTVLKKEYYFTDEYKDWYIKFIESKKKKYLLYYNSYDSDFLLEKIELLDEKSKKEKLIFEEEKVTFLTLENRYELELIKSKIKNFEQLKKYLFNPYTKIWAYNKLLLLEKNKKVYSFFGKILGVYKIENEKVIIDLSKKYKIKLYFYLYENYIIKKIEYLKGFKKQMQIVSKEKLFT